MEVDFLGSPNISIERMRWPNLRPQRNCEWIWEALDAMGWLDWKPVSGTISTDMDHAEAGHQHRVR